MYILLEFQESHFKDVESIGSNLERFKEEVGETKEGIPESIKQTTTPFQKKKPTLGGWLCWVNISFGAEPLPFFLYPRLSQPEQRPLRKFAKAAAAGGRGSGKVCPSRHPPYEIGSGASVACTWGHCHKKTISSFGGSIACFETKMVTPQPLKYMSVSVLFRVHVWCANEDTTLLCCHC